MDPAMNGEYRATNKVYRRGIIQAIDELHDFNIRSNIDSIRKHVQSSLGPNAIWNDALFLLSLKSLSSEGCIEPLASVNYGLSPEFKRRMIHVALEEVEKRQEDERIHPDHAHRRSSFPDRVHPPHQNHEKETPVKKTEHTKLKILPKKIFDGLHLPLKNPMATDDLEDLRH